MLVEFFIEFFYSYGKAAIWRRADVEHQEGISALLNTQPEMVLVLRNKLYTEISGARFTPPQYKLQYLVTILRHFVSSECLRI